MDFENGHVNDSCNKHFRHQKTPKMSKNVKNTMKYIYISLFALFLYIFAQYAYTDTFKITFMTPKRVNITTYCPYYPYGMWVQCICYENRNFDTFCKNEEYVCNTKDPNAICWTRCQ